MTISSIDPRLQYIIDRILREHEYSGRMNGPIKSTHEGDSLIREEYEELWELIKKDQIGPEMVTEIVHLASIAIHLFTDVVKIYPKVPLVKPEYQIIRFKDNIIENASQIFGEK